MNMTWHEKIHALADGQLAPDEAAEVEAYLADHPEARAEFDWVITVRQTLQTQCRGVRSEECWKKAMSQIDQIDRTRRANAFVGRYSWAFCGFALAVLAVGVLQNRVNGSSSLSQANVASLFSSLTPTNSAPVDQTTEALRQFFGSNPVDLSPSVMRMRQTAQGLIEGRPAVRFSCWDAAGKMTLFVVRGVERIEGMDLSATFATTSINGQPALMWTRQGFGYLLLGDRSTSDLERAASTLMGVR